MREVFFGCAITGVQAISDVSVLRQELQEAASISEFALRQRFLPDEADPSPRKRRSRPAGGIPWQTPQEAIQVLREFCSRRPDVCDTSVSGLSSSST